MLRQVLRAVVCEWAQRVSKNGANEDRVLWGGLRPLKRNSRNFRSPGRDARKPTKDDKRSLIWTDFESRCRQAACKPSGNTSAGTCQRFSNLRHSAFQKSKSAFACCRGRSRKMLRRIVSTGIFRYFVPACYSNESSPAVRAQYALACIRCSEGPLAKESDHCTHLTLVFNRSALGITPLFWAKTDFSVQSTVCMTPIKYKPVQ